MKERPTGITIIGAVLLGLGILSLLGGLLSFGVGGVTAVTSFFNAGGNAMWRGILSIATGAVQIFAGLGLLRLAKWAWLLALLGVGLQVVSGFLGLFGNGIGGFICGGIFLVIPVLLLLYLLRPDIRAAFD